MNLKVSYQVIIPYQYHTNVTEIFIARWPLIYNLSKAMSWRLSEFIHPYKYTNTNTNTHTHTHTAYQCFTSAWNEYFQAYNDLIASLKQFHVNSLMEH